MADVLKEFLVSLGFRIEGNQEQKFKSAVGSATKSVVDLGKAAAVASTAVSAAVIAIGKSLDSLYWQAQRTQTSVSQIRSATYAISQLGGSVDGARSSIESFGKQLRWHDGFEGYIRQLGVVTRENGRLRDSTVLAREFAVTIAKLPKGVQKAHADLAGMDLPTLEAFQSPEYQKNAAKHAETIKKLGVNEDEAARKSKDLVNSLTSLNDTFTALGTLLVDRLGPGLTDFFGKVERFLQNHSETIVAVFKSLGEAIGNVAAFLEKAAEWAGPLFQKFDALTKSLVGTDGLTAALTALIGLGVAAWLMKVAAAITSVGTAASVALLGGALGKFLGLFGIGAAIAIGASTEANAGEDQEIARRRAAGTFGPASAGDLAADAAKRQQGQSKDTSLWGKVKRWWSGGGDPSNGAATAPKGSAAKLAAAQESYDFWRSKGLSHEAASGLVANEEAESAFNPNARGDGGRAHGLYQHHPDRRANILRGTGIDMSSADARQQREGAYWEMTKGQERKTWNMLQGVTSAGEAGAIVSREYERPADRAGEANKRAAAANGWSARLQQQSTEAGSGGQAEAYRRKTGRDLQSDISSKDPYVRDWAAKEAGLTPNTKDDGGSVKMPSFGDRVREADRQTAMGRVQSYEDAIAQAGANVGKIDGGGLGGNGASLTPPPGSTAGTTVTVNQENHVSVTGSGDPHDTAQQIGNTQRDVNAGMVRDLKGAVR